MTKPTEFITPNLLELGEEIVKLTKQGFRIVRGPEQLGWQYYCEFVKDDVQDVVQETPVAPEATKRGPKPKKATTPTEA